MKTKEPHQTEKLKEFVTWIKGLGEFGENQTGNLFFKTPERIYEFRSEDFDKFIFQFCMERRYRISRDFKENCRGAIRMEKAKKITTHVRIAMDETTYAYDLKDGRYLQIDLNSGRCNIDSTTKFWFENFDLQAAQVSPVYNKFFDPLEFIKKYFRFKSLNDRRLFLVILISYLIPEIPRPLICLIGSEGSGKTKAIAFIKKLIDPAGTEHLPIDEFFKRNLYSEYLIAIDNLSKLSASQSDQLAKAITGDALRLRVYYTTNKMIGMQFKRAVVINGINSEIRRPDLADRTILFEFNRIPATERLTEHELLQSFEADRPYFLGYLFHILRQVLCEPLHLEIDALPRLADFGKFGIEIAERIGWSADEFLSYLNFKIREIKIAVGQDSDLCRAILSMTEGWRLQEEEEIIFQGSADMLLSYLRDQIRDGQIEVNHKYFPQSPVSLSRALNRIKILLEELGVEVRQIRRNKKRWWIIKIKE